MMGFLLMGLFKRKKENKKAEAVKESKPLHDVHMDMALQYYESKKYEQAFDMFQLVAENTNNSEAQHNLGSMYAQGLGIEQNFVEAAYWFHKAYENGEQKADKLTTKCLLDYANTVLKPEVAVGMSAKGIYATLSAFAKRVYNAENDSSIVRNLILELATYYLNSKMDYVMAAKLSRTGAEYENEPTCQNYLAAIYHAGRGLEKNDLAALYWFDKAAEQGVAAAKNNRDDILNAYANDFGAQETIEQLSVLVDWCTTGTNEAVPIDKVKADYWQKMIGTLQENFNQQSEEMIIGPLLERCRMGDNKAMLEMSRHCDTKLSNMWLVRAVLYGNEEAREILREDPKRAEDTFLPLAYFIPGERKLWFEGGYTAASLKKAGLDNLPKTNESYTVAGLSKERVFIIGRKTGYDEPDEDGFGAETYYDYYVYDEFFHRITEKVFDDDYRAAYRVGDEYIKTHNNLPNLRIDWLREDGIYSTKMY